MLAEAVVAILVSTIIFSLLFGILMWSRSIVFQEFYELCSKCANNQLKMLFERDIFIRRRSKVCCAQKDDSKYCLGFWEESDEELKYIVYDIHVDPGSEDNDVIFFRRYCMNQATLNGEWRTYCKNSINAITSGIYSAPTRIHYNDYTRDFKGTVYDDEGVLNVNYGDFQYTFPL